MTALVLGESLMVKWKTSMWKRGDGFPYEGALHLFNQVAATLAGEKMASNA